MAIDDINDGDNAGEAFGKINQIIAVINNVDPEAAALLSKNAEGQIEIDADVIVTGKIYAPTPLLHVQHRLPGASNPGTFSAGAWRNRPLNYEAWNDIDGASLDPVSYLMTLPAGLYEVDGISTAFYVQNNTARLINETTGDVLVVGDAGLSNNNSGYNNSGSSLRGRFLLTEETTVRLQHWCSTSRSSTGFGYRNVAAIDDTDAIYADLRFWKLK